MPRRRWCACETPEVTDSYRGTVRCDMYDSPEREKGGRLMPLFMMKQRIMETGCVISFSAPFIIISPTTFRGKLTRGHQPPWTTAGNITQRSTYGPFHRIRAPATQTAYGLRANILKLEECEESQMYSKRSASVCTRVCVSECVRCRAAVAVLCVDRWPSEVSYRNTHNLDWWEHQSTLTSCKLNWLNINQTWSLTETVILKLF